MSALSLMAMAGSLIVTRRWAEAQRGRIEPPIFFVTLVGNPSSGKSKSLETEDLARRIEALQRGSNP